MKHTIIVSLLLSGVAFAGSSAKEVIPPPPVPQPTLWNWFAGASAGYLADYGEEMYHVHFGVDLPYQGPCRHSLFLEAGWTGADDTFLLPITFSDSQLTAVLDTEVEIVPLTFNYKFERRFGEKFGCYLGAGAGLAFVDYTGTAGFIGGGGGVARTSESDTVFAAQIFGGVVYNVTEQIELYGGARWIYIDETSINAPAVGVDILEDDVLVEAGFRVNF